MIETVTKISGNSTSTNKMRHNTAQLSQVEVMLLCVTHLLLNKVTTTKWIMSSRSFGQFVFFVSVVILNMFWKCNLMWWNSDSDLTKWKCGTGRKVQWQKEQHAKKKPTEMNTTHLEWFQLHPPYLVSQQRPGLKNFLGLVFLFDRKKRLEEFRRLWGEDFKGAGNKKGRTVWNQPCMGTFGVNSKSERNASTHVLFLRLPELSFLMGVVQREPSCGLQLVLSTRSQWSCDYSHNRPQSSHKCTLAWQLQKTLNKKPDAPYSLHLHNQSGLFYYIKTGEQEIGQ